VIDQKVWLAARATSYTVVCEEWWGEKGCFAERGGGRLGTEREHTATCCTRGHPITVVRTFDDAVGVRLH
jgi:hypothetical protein